MSAINRKALYDKLLAEGKLDEAAETIKNHPEMAKEVVTLEEPETKSKKGK